MKTTTRGSWEGRALDALQDAGYRRGGARTAVIEALAKHDCAVTALDLEEELR
jgi:Fur family ferric uptake transcriptional regulator